MLPQRGDLMASERTKRLAKPTAKVDDELVPVGGQKREPVEPDADTKWLLDVIEDDEARLSAGVKSGFPENAR